ncbi:MAG: (5-formylfuran-3-yl)methyl phosphate synthase [Planctomycetaceae bacterium]
MTQLLVSARNVDEAIAAIEGGADIIDVKDPHRGSLGCAAPEVILAIADAISRIQGSKPPLSLALGELQEWKSSDLTTLRNAIQSAAPQFLKLGLAESCTAQGTASWIVEWERVRTTIIGTHEWVAVAYADGIKARSPSVDRILQAAIEGNCRILLIDTHTKNGTSLLDHLSMDALQIIRRQTREHGLKLALAGSVSQSDLPLLLRIQPDIIAVRGAVCEHGDRTATISKVRVQEFRIAMNKNVDPTDRSDQCDL